MRTPLIKTSRVPGASSPIEREKTLGVFKEAWTRYHQRQARQCQRDLTKAFAEKGIDFMYIERQTHEKIIKDAIATGTAAALAKWLPILKLFADAREEELRRPIGDLALAIVSAAWKCNQSVKPYLRPGNKFSEHPEIQEVYVFYEFLCFFIHLMNRQARIDLGPDRVAKLENEVRPLIIPSAVDAFFGHWPEKVKSRIESEFYNKLNHAKMEYANCKGLFPENGLVGKTDPFSRLAINILDLASYELVESDHPASRELIILVRSLVAENLDSAPLKDFGTMIEKAGGAIATLRGGRLEQLLRLRLWRNMN
jgi:hypothetical protein